MSSTYFIIDIIFFFMNTVSIVFVYDFLSHDWGSDILFFKAIFHNSKEKWKIENVKRIVLCNFIYMMILLAWFRDRLETCGSLLLLLKLQKIDFSRIICCECQITPPWFQSYWDKPGVKVLLPIFIWVTKSALSLCHIFQVYNNDNSDLSYHCISWWRFKIGESLVFLLQ